MTGADIAGGGDMTRTHGARIWGSLDPFFETGPIIGRRVANAGFLAALLAVDPFDAYHFFLPDAVSGEILLDRVRALCPAALSKVRVLPRTDLPASLAESDYHCFHLSDCLTAPGWLAALRNRVSRTVFPITGVTHSLSYARFGSAFAQHVWSGATRRDCIVATSRAGEAVVRAELARLIQAMPGANAPSVVRVPLGVCCRDFEQEPSPGSCSGLPAGATIFLVLGRISPYSKMDLVPVLRAFQRVAASGADLASVCLVLAGGSAESQSLPGTLANLARNIGLRLRVVSDPDENTKKALLDRADVVLSLADNPQETFGLTLLEAQASGTPVIVSDYDGYRDLVRDGQTGFLIPTVDSGAGELITLMAPLLHDTTSHLWLAQDVAVDVAVLARRITDLLDSQARARLGAAARAHARRFDWSEIIRRYVDLWDDLWTRDAPAAPDWRHPLALDYARLFAGYPTARLDAGDTLRSTALGGAVLRGRDFPVLHAGVADRIDLDLMRAVLVWTRRGITWEALLAKAEPSSRERMRSTVMWMLKGDMLERISAGGTDSLG